MQTTLLRKIDVDSVTDAHHPVLVLVRHAQSQWNKENRFTGWMDVGLSDEGIRQCATVAEQIRMIPFHVSYTSKLRRASRTLTIISEEIKNISPVVRSLALNERHYGNLQGMNKDEARAKFGKEQVHRWRRGFEDRPPGGESLKETCARTIPFFKNMILGDVRSGRNALVVAHGNSLRAITMYIEKLSPTAVTELEIPIATPICYTTK